MTIEEHTLNEIERVAAKWKDRPDMLIPVLHEAQDLAGGLPKEVADIVSREMRIPLSEICNVISFYAFFSKKKLGKFVIRLCDSAPCRVRGSKEVRMAFESALGIKGGETTKDGLFTLEICPCIGACDDAPAALIGDTVYGNLRPQDIPKLLSSLRKKV